FSPPPPPLSTLFPYTTLFRSLFRCRDALLQGAHIGRQRRLIADRRRDAAQQCRHLRARLREAEDVVDKEQHVLAFLVAEIFGQRSEEHTSELQSQSNLVCRLL